MTERGARSVERSATSLRIGRSALAWDGASLSIALDEVTAPWPSRIRGTVRLSASSLPDADHALDAAGHHRWRPIAPCAGIEVDLAQPASRWSGHGYFDSNHGTRPLERDFARWHWSRARSASGRTSVLYDVTRRDGSELGLALRFEPGSTATLALAAPAPQALPRSAWRIQRATRSDADGRAEIVASLEDGPFYARSLLRSRLLGEDVTAVHESLDLDRFASPWVQAMLPFRMPRRR